MARGVEARQAPICHRHAKGSDGITLVGEPTSDPEVHGPLLAAHEQVDRVVERAQREAAKVEAHGSEIVTARTALTGRWHDASARLTLSRVGRRVTC